MVESALKASVVIFGVLGIMVMGAGAEEALPAGEFRLGLWQVDIEERNQLTFLSAMNPSLVLERSEEGELTSRVLRRSLKDAELIQASLELAEKDGGEAVEYPDWEVPTWELRFPLGEMDVKELSVFEVAYELNWERGKKVEERTTLSPPTSVSMGNPPISLFEALGRVPAEFEAGKEVRWKSSEMMLRAFPENKSIYFRRDVRKETDIRISLEAAKNAERVMKERDRVKMWCEEVVQPALEALVERGDPGIFEIWK